MHPKKLPKESRFEMANWTTITWHNFNCFFCSCLINSKHMNAYNKPPVLSLVHRVHFKIVISRLHALCFVFYWFVVSILEWKFFGGLSRNTYTYSYSDISGYVFSYKNKWHPMSTEKKHHRKIHSKQIPVTWWPCVQHAYVYKHTQMIACVPILRACVFCSLRQKCSHSMNWSGWYTTKKNQTHSSDSALQEMPHETLSEPKIFTMSSLKKNLKPNLEKNIWSALIHIDNKREYIDFCVMYLEETLNIKIQTHDYKNVCSCVYYFNSRYIYHLQIQYKKNKVPTSYAD